MDWTGGRLGIIKFRLDISSNSSWRQAVVNCFDLQTIDPQKEEDNTPVHGPILQDIINK